MELVCIGIVAVYVALRLMQSPGSWRRLAVLAVASWIGEDTVIRAYGFYAYERDVWHVFLDQVPLCIVLIWPVVIDSAWTLAARLAPSHVPLLGAAFVLADASLIEPVAVRAGLWHWTAPGLFAVPPVGILGWAIFAGACMAIARRGILALVLGAPLVTHLILVAVWWGGLRWIGGATIPGAAAAIAAWLVLLPLAAWALCAGLRRSLPIGELLVRIPGASFFLVLLALHGRGDVALVAYALAFVPPYLALTPFRLSRSALARA